MTVLMLTHSGSWTDVRLLVFDDDDDDVDKQVHTLLVDQMYWLVTS